MFLTKNEVEETILIVVLHKITKVLPTKTFDIVVQIQPQQDIAFTFMLQVDWQSYTNHYNFELDYRSETMMSELETKTNALVKDIAQFVSDKWGRWVLEEEKRIQKLKDKLYKLDEWIDIQSEN